MAAFLVGLSAVSIISGASTSFLVGCLTSSTYAVYLYLNRIRSYNHPYIIEIKKELSEIDLQFTIDIINELFKDYPVNTESSSALKHAIYGVTEVMREIESNLILIDEAIKHHNSLYFNRWRSFDCSCNLVNIKSNKKVLDKRYKTFISLLKLEELKKHHRVNQEVVQNAESNKGVNT